MTKITVSSALQFSISFFNNILNFNPEDWNYHVTKINTQLNHILVNATTSTSFLYPDELLQHIST